MTLSIKIEEFAAIIVQHKTYFLFEVTGTVLEHRLQSVGKETFHFTFHSFYIISLFFPLFFKICEHLNKAKWPKMNPETSKTKETKATMTDSVVIYVVFLLSRSPDSPEVFT